MSPSVTPQCGQQTTTKPTARQHVDDKVDRWVEDSHSIADSRVEIMPTTAFPLFAVYYCPEYVVDILYSYLVNFPAAFSRERRPNNMLDFQTSSVRLLKSRKNVPDVFKSYISLLPRSRLMKTKEHDGCGVRGRLESESDRRWRRRPRRPTWL